MYELLFLACWSRKDYTGYNNQSWAKAHWLRLPPVDLKQRLGHLTAPGPHLALFWSLFGPCQSIGYWNSNINKHSTGGSRRSQVGSFSRLVAADEMRRERTFPYLRSTGLHLEQPEELRWWSLGALNQVALVRPSTTVSHVTSREICLPAPDLTEAAIPGGPPDCTPAPSMADKPIPS